MKRCSKCGDTKPLDDFYAQQGCKDGRRPECKVCQRAANQRYRDDNREALREYDRIRYPNRAEEARLRARAHYKANREQQLILRKLYYAANPEVFERSRAKRNALKRAVEHQPYTRREIYDRDGGTCRGCRKALTFERGGFQIDHIVPLTLGGPDTPANVQLMCPACNRKKWSTLEGQIHFAA